MNKKEEQEIDVENLIDAYERLRGALNDLKDIEEFSSMEYEQLYDLTERVNDIRRSKEIYIDILEEDM